MPSWFNLKLAKLWRVNHLYFSSMRCPWMCDSISDTVCKTEMPEFQLICSNTKMYYIQLVFPLTVTVLGLISWGALLRKTWSMSKSSMLMLMAHSVSSSNGIKYKQDRTRSGSTSIKWLWLFITFTRALKTEAQLNLCTAIFINSQINALGDVCLSCTKLRGLLRPLLTAYVCWGPNVKALQTCPGYTEL